MILIKAASIFLAALSIPSCHAFTSLGQRVAPHSTQHTSNTYTTLQHRSPKSKLYAADLAADTMEVPDGNSGKQGLALSTFNLVKACVGSGVLALSAGVGAIGDVSSV